MSNQNRADALGFLRKKLEKAALFAIEKPKCPFANVTLKFKVLAAQLTLDFNFPRFHVTVAEIRDDPGALIKPGLKSFYGFIAVFSTSP